MSALSRSPLLACTERAQSPLFAHYVKTYARILIPSLRNFKIITKINSLPILWYIIAYLSGTTSSIITYLYLSLFHPCENERRSIIRNSLITISLLFFHDRKSEPSSESRIPTFRPNNPSPTYPLLPPPNRRKKRKNPTYVMVGSGGREEEILLFRLSWR